MFALQNAETKVEEAAKESPKAARLTQQSSEDNEVFGELTQLEKVIWSCKLRKENSHKIRMIYLMFVYSIWVWAEQFHSGLKK